MSAETLKDVTNYNYGLEKIFDAAQDFLPINGTDYVELYVGNANRRHIFIRRHSAFNLWHMPGWRQA